MSGRLLRAAVAFGWSAFLLRLWLTGDQVNYVGPRTAWVVPFGGVVFGLVGVVALLRSHGAVDWRAPVLLALPLGVFLLMPSADLGAYAAAKKLAPPPPPAVARGSTQAPRKAPPKPGPLDVYDLQYATQYDDAYASQGIYPGRHVDVTGFVTHPKGEHAGTFALTRFVIWCCLADVLPYRAQVKAGRDYPDDTWLRVVGTTRVLGRRLVVRASRVQRVPKPHDVYLTHEL